LSYTVILGIILSLSGALCVFMSPVISKKLNLSENVKCDFDKEMTEEEVHNYKEMKASVNVKMAGMLLLLPGLIIVLISYN
jgi:UPF0716 family protein affecting phage T7 exclusion